MKRMGAELRLLKIAFICLVFFCAKTGARGENTGVSDPQPDPPRVKVTEHVFDFGTADQHQKIPHVFRFSNVGGSPLLVEKVRSSCGCTAALASEKVIPPGGEGEIRITFSTGRMSGKKSKSVFLHSNDPDQPITTFKIKGEIRVKPGAGKTSRIKRVQSGWPEQFKRGKDPAIAQKRGPRNYIEIDPRTCIFGTVRKGEPAVKTLTLQKKGKEEDFTVTGARSTLPFVSVEFNKVDPGKYTAAIRLSGEAPEGRFLGSVVFYTDDPMDPSLIVRTFGEVTEGPEPEKSALPKG